MKVTTLVIFFNGFCVDALVVCVAICLPIVNFVVVDFVIVLIAIVINPAVALTGIIIDLVGVTVMVVRMAEYIIFVFNAVVIASALSIA